MDIHQSDAERAEQVAPFLVLLSMHMPEVCEHEDEYYVACSCGNGLYAGHLVQLLADGFTRKADLENEPEREES